ncbi:MAG: trigger factor [Pseudolabrys sp.]|nr:trigger factor [Pseudolabrys sp.]
MQVTQTLSEGLKREFKVSVPASELDARVNERLEELKQRVQLPGFRPGKVPVSHLKRVYGRSAMAEVIEATVRDANTHIVSENKIKLASEPKVTLPTEEKAIEQILNGKTDLDYTVAIEIVPPIALADFKTIKLEKLSADVTDKEIDEGVAHIAEQSKPYAPKGEGAKAEKGDKVTIDFVGSIDGAPFEGGAGGDVGVNIGSNTFIPGFEDQLIGVAAGDKKTISVTFPDNYMSEALAGKAASFDVTVKSIEAPGKTTIDDAFAKTLGVESLAKLRDLIKERVERDHVLAGRQKLKRSLLDQIDAMHKFDAPPSLVQDEFNRVWQSVQTELQSQRKTFADEGTTEDKAREEYGEIASRRVRLGLVLAEIGEKNGITVTDEEVNRAVVEQARQYPGQEQRIWDYYRQNPDALAGLRAPIFEEKVVDFLVELAQVTEKKVSREELFKDDDADK